MSIYVAGSLAFDRIMSFNGAFADHILADKLHILNVSFLIDGLVEKRGGCAGNIAYALALMGEKPLILATAGKNFSEYGAFLESKGISLEGVRVMKDEFTASCTLITDKNNNQINIPEARAAMDKFKMEAASEVGVNLKQGYNGDITAKQAGSVGGQMVNNMNPVRTMRFERHSRISQGHKITVKYAFSLTV